MTDNDEDSGEEKWYANEDMWDVDEQIRRGETVECPSCGRQGEELDERPHDDGAGFVDVNIRCPCGRSGWIQATWDTYYRGKFTEE